MGEVKKKSCIFIYHLFYLFINPGLLRRMLMLHFGYRGDFLNDPNLIPYPAYISHFPLGRVSDLSRSE